MPAVFAEMQGSPLEELGDVGQPRVTRMLKCAWGDRWELAADLYGAYYPVAQLPEGYALPMCRSISIQPFEGQNLGDGAVCAYEAAIVTAIYDATPGYAYTVSLEPWSAFLPVEVGPLTWGAAPGGASLKREDCPGVLNRGLDYIVVEHDVATVSSAIKTLHGCVNNAPLAAWGPGLAGSWTFETETLLLKPPVCQFHLGLDLWTITYRYTYRPNYVSGVAKGWNWFWNSKLQTFEPIYNNDTSSQFKPYIPADFAAIWPTD